MTYAELQTTTNFGFLRGASQPEELVLGAKALGLAAIGVADRNTLAGVVRAWSRGKEIGQRVLSGSRLVFADDTPQIVIYPRDREAWGRLTRLLTLGQRRAKKGGCHLTVHDLEAHVEGQLMLVVPPAKLTPVFETCLRNFAGDHAGRVWLLASRPYGAQDLKRLAKLDALARRCGAPMVASNDVLYHGRERRALQDVLTCIREGCTITEAGLRLQANAERHLKAADEMIRLFKDYPEAVKRTVEITERIGFDLSHLKYEYPHEPVPPGKTAIGHLSDLAWAGATWRFRHGITPDLESRLRNELALIEQLNYPHYFLTVHDVVHWARSKGILCQGRGSAANSLVCFCLGVTAVDPTEEDHDMLFARFISRERDEPPDIDVDFEHDRREEVMQYVYWRYGRDRAAICATVIHYRPRSAIRDVGKALGLTEDVTAVLANTVWGSLSDGLPDEHIKQAGLDPKSPDIRRAVTLATQLLGFPRHLSQHVGGFVLTERRLDETVPIGNGAMKDRTFIEWDKDDIDALGLMKVDILALGMLTAIKRAMDMLGIADMADIPEDDVAVYDMLSKADSVGVFQVESRAQMSMLPRMKPRRFYDLAIEVAIVRPGPIQGGMVHPYLKRREKLETVIYPRPAPEHGLENELEQVLGKTLGVPLFQEQAMRLAIEAAKFTPEEANGLRRAMATFRNHGDVGVYRKKFIDGMVRRGYDSEFAQRCFKQIEGFGSYGFPESHAISFAKLVYVSAWIKCYRPDVFCAALLNSQPMGFYQPAQLVRDAREHGVEVRPPDVMWSNWDCTLEEVHLFQREREEPSEVGRQRGEDGAEKGAQVRSSSTPYSPSASRRAPPSPSGRGVLRLGLRQIRGLSENEAEQLIYARNAGARTLGEFTRIGDLSRSTLEVLAEADAFRSLGMNRRAALWAVKGVAHEARVETEAPLLAMMGMPDESAVNLPAMALSTHVAEDYRTTSLSLRAHPCQFFRPLLTEFGAVTAASLRTRRDGSRVAVGGLVLIRQRPGTAKGIVFLTLEDETGSANAVVWSKVFTPNRREAMTASFLIVHGRIQRAGDIIHVVADRFTDLSIQLRELRREGSLEDTRLVKSRNFH